MEANLAAPMVDEFCRVDDSFHALARRFAANVEKPGTGIDLTFFQFQGISRSFILSMCFSMKIDGIEAAPCKARNPVDVNL